MSEQMRKVQLRIPVLNAYSSPLFIHHMKVILGQAFQGMSVTEGESGARVKVEVPMEVQPQDVVGFARASLMSIGVNAQPELIE